MVFFFFKQKTAYEMRISDWSSDVCSSDLGRAEAPARRSWRSCRQPLRRTRIGQCHDFARRGDAVPASGQRLAVGDARVVVEDAAVEQLRRVLALEVVDAAVRGVAVQRAVVRDQFAGIGVFRQHFRDWRSEKHTSELQSLMRISYAVFCLKKKKHKKQTMNQSIEHYKQN